MTTVSRPFLPRQISTAVWYLFLRTAIDQLCRFIMFNHQRFQACEYSNLDWLMDAECHLITIYDDR